MRGINKKIAFKPSAAIFNIKERLWTLNAIILKVSKPPATNF